MLHASMEIVGAAELVRVHAKVADSICYIPGVVLFILQFFIFKVRPGLGYSIIITHIPRSRLPLVYSYFAI